VEGGPKAAFLFYEEVMIFEPVKGLCFKVKANRLKMSKTLIVFYKVLKRVVNFLYPRSFLFHWVEAAISFKVVHEKSVPKIDANQITAFRD
jgi:hypothetical protein